jgi:hypothetical protein
VGGLTPLGRWLVRAVAALAATGLVIVYGEEALPRLYAALEVLGIPPGDLPR